MSQISGRDERRLGEVDMVATDWPDSRLRTALCDAPFPQVNSFACGEPFRRRRLDGWWFMAIAGVGI